MGQNIVGIEKKSAGQIYRNTLYCLFLTNRATHDSTLLGCPKPLVVEIAFSGIFLHIFISRKLPQLWEGSCNGRWLYTEYYHSTLLLSVMARVILRCIGVSWVSLVISFLSQRNIKTPSRCKNTTAKYTKCFC